MSNAQGWPVQDAASSSFRKRSGIHCVKRLATASWQPRYASAKMNSYLRRMPRVVGASAQDRHADAVNCSNKGCRATTVAHVASIRWELAKWCVRRC